MPWKGEEKMFYILTSGNGTAWDTDQLMRMDVGRFKEYSDSGVQQPLSNFELSGGQRLSSVGSILRPPISENSVGRDIFAWGGNHFLKKLPVILHCEA